MLYFCIVFIYKHSLYFSFSFIRDGDFMTHDDDIDLWTDQKSYKKIYECFIELAGPNYQSGVSFEDVKTSKKAKTSQHKKQYGNSFSYVIFPFFYATNNERTQTVIPRLFYR